MQHNQFPNNKYYKKKRKLWNTEKGRIWNVCQIDTIHILHTFMTNLHTTSYFSIFKRLIILVLLLTVLLIELRQYRSLTFNPYISFVLIDGGRNTTKTFNVEIITEIISKSVHQNINLERWSRNALLLKGCFEW